MPAPLAPRTAPPFRADHVGSLLRPPEVVRARERFEAGLIPSEELRAVEDEAIGKAVRMQEEVGLRAATDGELRRRSWQGDFLFQLGGISTVAGAPSFPREFTTAGGKTLVPPQGSVRVAGKVSLAHTIFGDDFQALRAMTVSAMPKLTIPSPSMLYLRCGRSGIDEGVYPDLDEFWSDVVAAYR
jgi:5-methyltetrahydropteroyltriglutamate--homocysteine methyltransferase